MPSARMRYGLAALLASALAFAIAGAATASATLPTISIAVTKTSATVSGPLESGAVNIASSDTGVKEGALILFQLKPGVSVAEAEAFIAQKKAQHDTNNTSKLGSLVFDTEVNSGKRGEAQVELAPAQYLVLVGEGEGEVKLRATLTVTAAKAPAALPAAQAKERSIEFGFRGPSVLHEGELVSFENEGFLVHMDVAFPVKSMGAAHAAVRDLLTGREKGLQRLIAGPPVTFAGPLSHGAAVQETISAKPGIYVQVCFMQTQDGRDHALLGMERIIRIVK